MGGTSAKHQESTVEKRWLNSHTCVPAVVEQRTGEGEGRDKG